MKKWLCLIAFGMCMLLAAKQWNVHAAADNAGVIANGVWLDGLDVSGMTKDEAQKAYEQYIDGAEDLTFTLSDRIGSHAVTLEDLGFSVSIEDAVEQAYSYGKSGNILSRYKEITGLKEKPAVLIPEKTIDEEKMDQILDDAWDMKCSAENASIKRVDGKFIIYDGVTGVDIDNDETIAKFEKLLQRKWTEKDLKMDAVVIETEPDYTADDFYYVDSLLGRAATEYSSSNENRCKNLSTGAAKIAGTVLLPGEQFSMYNTVAPFTEENGYADAGMYVNGGQSVELVDGIGGGICQVSTTLYNAVLKAELTVDERYPHTLSVSYVDLSKDAAIAEGLYDFKFTNNTGYPVYIDGYAGGGVVSFAIYGHETRPSNRTISFESKKIETYEPGDPEKIYDDTLPAGTQVTESSGHTGYYAELWKHVYYDGVEAEDEMVRVNQSQYNPQRGKIRVGTK